MKMESKIHNTGFLISPTTHLFLFASQSGSREVSSMITFEIKIWNNAKLYQSIQSCMSVLNYSRKKGRMQKKWNGRRSPLGGWGAASKEPTHKRFYFIIIGYNISKLKYQKPLGPCTGWNKDLTTLQKFWILMNGETPGGIWTLPRPLLKSNFSSFLLHLLKTSKHVRIKYAQKHFKSTFGSTYLNSKKIKLN